MLVYPLIENAQQQKKKLFALLIDPDKHTPESLKQILAKAVDAQVDLLFVGGSILTHSNLDDCLDAIKVTCSLPVVLFPGNTLQVSPKADVLLFLSLISGRNPDLLIGQHVISAPMVKKSGLEIIPTGYILVESGQPTTASYMSNTFPIPHNKIGVAACTALAGEMLGLHQMYLDGGSGAKNPVSTEMITAVRKAVSTPIIVGGGIRDGKTALELCQAGADVIVVGNALEKDTSRMKEIANAIHQS